MEQSQNRDPLNLATASSLGQERVFLPGEGVRLYYLDFTGKLCYLNSEQRGTAGQEYWVYSLAALWNPLGSRRKGSEKEGRNSFTAGSCQFQPCCFVCLCLSLPFVV